MRRSRLVAWSFGVGLVVALAIACAASPDPARVADPDPSESGVQVGRSTDDPDPDDDAEATPQVNGNPRDPFEAGVTYDKDLVSIEATAHHAEAGAPPPRTNADCLSCHGDGNAGATKKFAAGGITFATDGADGGLGDPCIACDLLFVDSVGHRVKVTTANDGTFVISADDYGAVSPGTHVGLRKGGIKSLMDLGETVDEAGKLRGCNNSRCHDPNATENPIVLGAN